MLHREDWFSLAGILAAIVLLAILFVSTPAHAATEGVPAAPEFPVCDVPTCEAAMNACLEAKKACEEPAMPTADVVGTDRAQ